MIKGFNQKLQFFNEFLGIQIKLPDPPKRSLSVFAILNFLVGCVILCFGFLFSSKWCGLLGLLGITSAGLMRYESCRR